MTRCIAHGRIGSLRSGIKRELLPQVLPAGARMSYVSQAAAKRFGFAATAAVMAGTTDGCASFLATGASRPGEGVTALGSTLTVKILSREPLFAPEFGLYSHRIGNMWLAGGASNTGGIVLRHFFDDARVRELEGLIDPATDLGLDFYPLVQPGERFPVNDPDLAPRMEPRPAEDHHFLQALLEGMAGIEALAYQRLGELGAPGLVSIRTVRRGGAECGVERDSQAQACRADAAGPLRRGGGRDRPARPGHLHDGGGDRAMTPRHTPADSGSRIARSRGRS